MNSLSRIYSQSIVWLHGVEQIANKHILTIVHPAAKLEMCCYMQDVMPQGSNNIQFDILWGTSECTSHHSHIYWYLLPVIMNNLGFALVLITKHNIMNQIGVSFSTWWSTFSKAASATVQGFEACSNFGEFETARVWQSFDNQMYPSRRDASTHQHHSVCFDHHHSGGNYSAFTPAPLKFRSDEGGTCWKAHGCVADQYTASWSTVSRGSGAKRSTKIRSGHLNDTVGDPQEAWTLFPIRGGSPAPSWLYMQHMTSNDTIHTKRLVAILYWVRYER